MKNTKAIGGYFELELGNEKNEFHHDAISLNTARNALEYVLLANNPKKLFLPYFTCDAILEPLNKLKIPFEFYSINEDLEPIFDFTSLSNNDAFLYTNYFGLKDKYIKQLSVFCHQLIVDNAQAFYSRPCGDVPTFYSTRKFFGVSDGAYLYFNNKLNKILDNDVSFERMAHLLIRKDVSAEKGYTIFTENDNSLKNEPIKVMSKITKSILRTIDYEAISYKRRENFLFLDETLKNNNKFSFKLDKETIPMVYPYWVKDHNLRKRLLENKIFTATYWPNVFEWCPDESFEYKLATEVIYLPIDQRYDLDDMKKILNFV
jgi:hypothetical protein